MRILPLLATATLLAAAEPIPPFANGGFEDCDAQGVPAGWRLSGGATVAGAAGARCLVLSATNASCTAGQQLDLDPAWGTLRFRYRAKVDAIAPGSEGWHNARIALTFLDAAGKATHMVAGEWKAPTAGWTAGERLVGVPEGAVKMTVGPALFNATGTWAIDDLQVDLVARRGEGIDAEPPAGQAPTWGQEPVEAQGPRRSVVCLNGLWRFQPALGVSATTAQATGWGWLRVPGSWRDGPLPRLTARGTGPAWEGFNGETPAAWYERDLAVPAAWKGRAIVLDLRRVSTDAAVLIDGREVGRVAWPGGEVDCTAAVEPGRTHRLRIKVVAAADAAEVVRFMGMGDGQVLKEKVVLSTRGLIGDVLLASRPRGAVLTGCAIRTSVRGGRLAVEAEYAGATATAPVDLTAVVREVGTGAEVKRFAGTARAVPGAGTLAASWEWRDAKLWDLDQPNLYTLELTARGAGLDDALVEGFGFREFRVDGRRFLLNEREIRLRPAPVHAESSIGGISELIGGALDGLRWAGFNTHELWPWDRGERGTWEFDDLWCQEADRRGMLLIVPALCMTRLAGEWKRPGVRDGWAERMAPMLKRLRNHPSAVMWVTGANRFGHGQDQNPEAIGSSSRAWIADGGWRSTAEGAGRDAIALIKRVDPTRPVFMHAGGPVGDVYTSNNYLCLTPLQEREEWLSRWAADGDMPVLMVEFGTPLYTTFHRGRRGYGMASTSEPLYTEFCAIYQGAEAYRLEAPAYRETLARTFDKDQLWHTWHPIEAARFHEGFNRLQALFQTNTWRTWRTWGVTGGILPWCNGHGWLRDASSASGGGPGAPAQAPVGPLKPFAPGQRGAWRPEATIALKRYFRPEGMPMTVAGKALVAANQDVLAWIAGTPDFTDKTHLFRAGQTVAKQVAVVNDGRTARRFSAEWRVELAGAVVASGRLAGEAKPASTTLLPLAFTLPASLAGDKVEGAITMVCDLGGGVRQEDRFPFRAFRPAQTAVPQVALLDPVGDTAALLKALGVPSAPWDGKAANRLLVVGRNALATGGADPAALERCLQAGGRVLLMAQDPDWLRERLGLRVSWHQTRRAFPVQAGHPAMHGLDAEDLRDWAGSSRLLPAADGSLADANSYRTPVHGWRWGTRHTVSSAAIEVPHRAGWRPIVACEFDGAYSPLAEVAIGTGMLTVCTFDLEDHAQADPAAERLARTILVAAATARGEPREPAAYLGGDEGAALLATAGVLHRRAAELPVRGLAVLGADAAPADAALDAFLRRGGRLLVLPRRAAAAPLGVRLASSASHAGSLAVPEWASCRGLWPGELRRRADGPAWTVAGGADAVGADGLLAEVRRGEGVAVFCQLDAGLLDADRLSYNRYTRWRWTRVLNQLASNLGGASEGAARLVHPIPLPERIALAGTWKAALTQRLPGIGASDPKPRDPGIGERARALVAKDADEAGMQQVQASKEWEGYGGAWADADGEAVFRRTIDIPAAWAGRDLVLSLGAVDDFDTAFFDGQAVGSTDITVKNFWNTPRLYAIPARLVTPGRHVIAVRVFDHFGGGGLVGGPEQLHLEPKAALVAPPASVYHPDWRDDFNHGDDPYRYYRW